MPMHEVVLRDGDFFHKYSVDPELNCLSMKCTISLCIAAV